MIKVIIFDADGVVILSKRKFSVALAENYNISAEKTRPFFEGPFQDCLVGQKDLKEAITPYLADWGWSKGADALLEYWFELEREEDKELIKYIHELRQKGVQCFLATNNEKHRFQYMLDKVGLKGVFDKTYSSAHLGHKKPSEEFFAKIFSELVNIKKEEILFVDDSPENIEGAKKFGIHAMFYTSLQDFKDKFAVLK